MSWGNVYLIGFMVMFLWCLWCELRGGKRCCWVGDLVDAGGITIWSLLWPLALLGILLSIMLTLADKGKLR